MNMKNIFRTLACVLVLGGSLLTTSCTDEFLTETKKDAISSDWLNEPEGLLSMAESLYLEFNYFFSNESSYSYTNYGTDEFMVAGDNSNEMWNCYDARLGSVVTPTVNSNTQSITTFWDTLYQWNARANTIIANGENMAAGATRNEALGVAYFVRGFNYLFLTMQWGDIPLVTEPVTTPEREYVRNSQKDVYEQIISDLEQAHSLLSGDASRATKNYITKYAAAHYLAKAHLWRASEINDSWNSSYKSADLNAVITYADEVIAAHPLTPNYEDLYGNFTAYDTSITETNSEIVLSSGSSDSATTNRKSNWGLALFTAWYQSFPLMKRDVAGAREYQRMKTTPSYAYFIYDLENDSRFWKSFKTTYAVNDCVTNSKKGAASYTLGDGTTIKASEYFDNDDEAYLSAMYIINRKEYGQQYYKDEVNTVKAPSGPSLTRIDYNTGKYIPTIMALYIYDEKGNVVGTSMQPDFETLHAPLSKYLDGAVNANNRGDGFRDGILARSAEDYFFKAEALVRQGKINEGLAAVQPIRERAQYKAGEQRDDYVDGGHAYAFSSYKASLKGYTANSAFYGKNSYFYSVGGWDDAAKRQAMNAQSSVLPKVTSSSYPAEDQYVIDKLGYTSDYDKALCFLLNEKSREMYGEYLRWMDLARTKTLEKRLIFNDQAYSTSLKDITGSSSSISGTAYASSSFGGSFKASQHYYRPIPQTFLDNITKDGIPLTADEKNAMQNPGY